jgi:hypothetical protein
VRCSVDRQKGRESDLICPFSSSLNVVLIFNFHTVKVNTGGKSHTAGTKRKKGKNNSKKIRKETAERRKIITICHESCFPFFRLLRLRLHIFMLALLNGEMEK